jgi:hypothetical protein
VKRDELFSLIFFSTNTILWRWNQVKWTHEEGNTPWPCQGGWCGLVGVSPPGAHLRYFFAPAFFVNSIKNPLKVSGHSENFYFCTKTTPWQFC